MKNRFKIHELQGQIESIYIAEYDDKLLLLDGGSRCDTRIIEEYITDTIKRSIDLLKLIVVTHMHPDHAGAAQILRKKYGTPIAAFHTSDLWYSGVSGWLQHKLDIFLSWFVVLKTNKPFKKMYYQRKVNADYLLNDGDSLPFFNGWKAYHMPGHTTHDIVLYNQSEKILYASDIILKVNNKFMLPFPITIPHFMEESLIKLSKFKINRILMAHGGEYKPRRDNNIFLEMINVIHKPHTREMRRLQPFTMLSKEIRKMNYPAATGRALPLTKQKKDAEAMSPRHKNIKK